MDKYGKFCWTKKLGDMHLSGKNITLCGKPMLGNNYSDIRKDVPMCKECESQANREIVRDAVKEAEMTVEQAVTKFHWCCAAIVKEAYINNAKALNYCGPYAKLGLTFDSIALVKAQVPYVLDNMTHWRGDLAKKVRKYLKEVTHALRNY